MISWLSGSQPPATRRTVDISRDGGFISEYWQWSHEATLRELLREKGTPFAELGLDNPGLTDTQLVDAMMAHPVLINRPLVVSPLGVKLCRPSEAVLDLIPAGQREAFAKEDGEQVIDASGNRVSS